MTDLVKPGDLAASDNLAELAAALGRAARSAATRRAYAADVARFDTWCRRQNHATLPAAPEVVGLYIAYLFSLTPKVSVATIERAVAGIAFQHRQRGFGFDRQHPAIAQLLAGARRQR